MKYDVEKRISEIKPHLKYQRKLVSFIDILGWKEILRKSETDPEIIKLIGESLERARYDFKFAHKFSPPNRIKFTMFSDCVVASAELSREGMVMMESFLLGMSTRLASLRFFVRGGLVIGNVYHESDIVFGPALVDAVRLEKQAKYPRIVTDSNLIDQVLELDPSSDMCDQAWYKWDDGGKWKDSSSLESGGYLDFLRHLRDYLKDLDLQNELMKSVYRSVTHWMDSERDNDGIEKLDEIRKKYQWLGQYYNVVLAESKSSELEAIPASILGNPVWP